MCVCVQKYRRRDNVLLLEFFSGSALVASTERSVETVSTSHTIFSLLQITDFVPQTFAHGVTSEAQTFQKKKKCCLFSIARANEGKDCMTDVTFIRSILVPHAANSVPTLFSSSRLHPQKGYQTHDL